MAGVACQENGMKKLVEKTGSNFQIIRKLDLVYTLV